MEITEIPIDIAPGVEVVLTKTQGWERRLRDRTIAEGKRLRKLAEAPYVRPRTKVVEPPKPQSDFGDMFDLEENT